MIVSVVPLLDNGDCENNEDSIISDSENSIRSSSEDMFDDTDEDPTYELDTSSTRGTLKPKFSFLIDKPSDSRNRPLFSLMLL